MAKARGFEQLRGAESYAQTPEAFVDKFLPYNERREAWRLSAYQRAVLALALRFDPAGRLLLRLLLWSEPKKSGKTLLAAALVIWWAATRYSSEVIVVASDKEQAVGRVFRSVVQLCRANALESAGFVRVRAAQVEFSTGTLVTAIASEYRGAAGSRHSLVVYDELWTYDREALSRLYEELTPPPTEPDAWVLVVTYAGFSGQSELLETMYRRGLEGERVGGELEAYRAGEMFMFWSHTPRQPWQTPEYYAEQRRSLRPTTFARIHENRWVSGEGAFVAPEQWDAVVDPALAPVLGIDREVAAYVGVDAGVKSDTSAIVAVAWEGRRLRVVGHRIFRPAKDRPVSLADVEAYVLDLDRRFDLQAVACDPWQMFRSIQALQAQGVPMRETTFSAAHTTEMANGLYDLIASGTLRCYPDPELRQAVLNASVVETGAGLKLAKATRSKKVDAAVALALAAQAALADMDLPPLMLASSAPPKGSAYHEYLQSRGSAGSEEPEGGDDELECTEAEMAERADRDEWEPVA